MTMPLSGVIGLGDAAKELAVYDAPLSLGQQSVRTLAEDDGGQIAMSQLYGKSNAILVDYIVMGGGGNYANGSVGGGNAQIGSMLIGISETLPVVIGGVGGNSTFKNLTASAGQNGDNSGVHWGWDDSTNCDAFPGGPGGAPTGTGGTGGEAYDISGGSYVPYAQGGNGGNGNQWAINGVWYSGGLGGIRTGAGGGGNGSNGLGWDNYGGGNRSGGAIFSYPGPQKLTGGIYSFDGTRSYHTFAGSGELNPQQKFRYLVIGGGGSNGYDPWGDSVPNYPGGAGQVLGGTLDFPTAPVNIVAGGINQASTLGTLTALAGQPGAENVGQSGSGNQPGRSVYIDDLTGGGPSIIRSAAGGGGAGHAGGGSDAYFVNATEPSTGEWYLAACGGNGGNGTASNITGGAPKYYAGGRAGWRDHPAGVDATNGLGFDAPGGSERAGVVYISYLGVPRYSGGVVSTTPEGATLHTFENGTFTLTPI